MKGIFADETAAGCIEPILANWSAFLPDCAEACDTLVCNGIIKILLETILGQIFGL